MNFNENAVNTVVEKNEIENPVKNVLVNTAIEPIVFYPGYGICQYIESDSKYHYFKALSLLIKITIPIKNSQHRSLMSPQEAISIQNRLTDNKECYFGNVWNQRKKSFINRIYTGAPEKILEVVNELNYVATKKILSYSEKEILKTAKNLLLDELAVVLKLK